MTPATEIAEELAALRDGRVSLEAVAAAFRQRRWRSSRGADLGAADRWPAAGRVSDGRVGDGRVGGSAVGDGGVSGDGEASDGGGRDPLPDPGPSVPGSVDEIIAAYDRGELTREQYRVLAHAVAEAINAEDR